MDSAGRILEVEHLTKKYGAKAAVADISFVLSANEIVGLLGPNGAGKTTTLNMILGLLAPDEGQIRILDLNLNGNREKALAQMNFAAAYSPLPGNLTVRQNLNVFAHIYGIDEIEERIEKLLKAFHLERFADTRVGKLSSGEQTRVSLAKAMLNRPRLLLLDEPTSSLDPSVAHEIRNIIKEFAKSNGTGILWTSHNMYEVEEVCDRVLFLVRSKILMQGNPRTLPHEYGLNTLEELFIRLAREDAHGPEVPS